MFAGFWDRWSTANMATRIAVLAALMIVSGIVIIPVGVIGFQTSIQTALLALLVCLVAGVIAHVAGEHPKGDVFIMARMMIQMAVRTSIPFAFALWAINFANPPLEKSLVFYIILFYMVGLVSDLQLNLARIKANDPSNPKVDSAKKATAGK